MVSGYDINNLVNYDFVDELFDFEADADFKAILANMEHDFFGYF